MTIKLLTQYRKEPYIFYTPEMLQYIDEIVARSDDEVSWIGCGDRINDDEDWLINEVYVLPQEVHATECEFEDDAVSDWAEAYMEAGGDTTRFVLWGHSHVDMATSPSTTDQEQALKYIKDCPKFICAIHNKRGTMHHDVFYRDEAIWFSDVDAGMWVDPMSDEDSKKLDELLKANVTKRKLTPMWKGGAYGSATNQGRTTYQQQQFKLLPIKSTDATAQQMNIAGCKTPTNIFGTNGLDTLGLDLYDYWQYYIDTGDNGAAGDVYSHLFGTDKGTYVNQSYLSDLDDEDLYDWGPQV